MAEVKTMNEVLKEIAEANSNKASDKTNAAIMRAMITDKDFNITVFDGKGNAKDTVNPHEKFTSICSEVLSQAGGVSKTEAAGLAEGYTPSPAVAANMVDISKAWLGTTLQSGTKVALWNTETSKCTLKMEHKEASTTKVPSTGEEKQIPAFDKIKASSSCPSWLKK